jgi:hypothetical protein
VNVVGLGRISGQASLGGTALVANGTMDIAVAKYRARTARTSGRSASVAPTTTTATPSPSTPPGNVYMTGYFRGVIDFGGGTMRVPYDTDLDVFVTKLDMNGNHVWSKNFPNDGNDRGYGIATDGLSVAGRGHVLEQHHHRHRHARVAERDDRRIRDEAFGRERRTGVGSPDRRPGREREGYGVAFDASGNVDVCGFATKGVDFGGGVLAALGSSDAWVASYRGTTGAHIWSRRIGGMGNDYAYSLTVAPDGGVIVAGSFEGSAGFGGATLTPLGSGDAFVAKYTSAGAPTWARQVGGTSSDVDRSWPSTRRGTRCLAGYFFGTGVFGGSTLTSAGQADGFVTKLAP